MDMTLNEALVLLSTLTGIIIVGGSIFLWRFTDYLKKHRN